MTKREALMFCVMLGCICWAGLSSEAKPTPAGLTEKQGWLSAPALLPPKALLKTSPVEARVYILATRTKKEIQ